MRLLIVGPDEVYSIENFYTKYLKECGVTISHFTAQNIFYDYYHSSIIHKVTYLAGFSNIIKRINILFKKRVENFGPDVIWIFKGMEITLTSLKWAKTRGILLVNFNPDNPFIFTGRGSGNKNIKKSISLYDLHFTYNLNIQKELKTRYNIEAEFLPFGFDISDSIYQNCQQENEIIKICFLGNPDKQRASILIQLANNGVNIDLYGNKWERFISHKNIQIFNAVHGLEFWKTLYKYRVQLNLMRIHNEDSHNMRSFEIPAIGGIQLAPFTTEHQMLFKENEEIFLYKNAEDCVDKIKYLLSLSTSEAKALRGAAHRSVIKKGYSYQNRATYVYNKLEDLLKQQG